MNLISRLGRGSNKQRRIFHYFPLSQISSTIWSPHLHGVPRKASIMKEISLPVKSGRRKSLMWLRWHLVKKIHSHILYILYRLFILGFVFIQCSLILLRKTCTQSGIRKICTNHFGRKCFSYIYPQVTTTVEDNAEKSRENPDNNPDDQGETIMTELIWY